MIDKDTCDKWFTWNRSHCKCECDRSHDIGEYLDYENCKYRKKTVDELVEESTENTDAVKMARITLDEYEKEFRSSCTLYVVLLSVVFSINFGIALNLDFVCYKYMNHGKKSIAKEGSIFQTAIY